MVLILALLYGLVLYLWMERRNLLSKNEGVQIMYIVKDDNPDVEYRLGNLSAQDAEGNEIDGAELSTTISSSDPAVVKVTSKDQTSGKLSFGKPGTATVTATINAPNGQQIIRTANFVVTTGDVALISGGDLEIDGLTEAADETALASEDAGGSDSDTV